MDVFVVPYSAEHTEGFKEKKPIVIVSYATPADYCFVYCLSEFRVRVRKALEGKLGIQNVRHFFRGTEDAVTYYQHYVSVTAEEAKELLKGTEV